MRLPRGHSSLTFVCGCFALGLGALVLLGWLTHASALVRLNGQVMAMVTSTALCMALGGLSLISARWPDTAGRRTPLPTGALMALIAVAMLAQVFSSVDLGINLPAFHAWVGDASPRPGQMAPNTALAFLLLGVGLLTELFAPASLSLARLRWVLGAVAMVLGLTGLLVYFVRPELLFGWYAGVVRMAPNTAAGVMVLGIGYCARWPWPSSAQLDDLEWHRRGIFQTASITLTVVALLTGAAGFALQLNSVTQATEAHLAMTLGDRRLLLEDALASAGRRVEMTSANPLLIARMNAWWAAGARARSGLRQNLGAVAESLLPHGFSYVALEGPNGERAEAGRPIGPVLSEVRIQGRMEASLAWREGHGHVVRHRQPILDGDKTVGYLLTEQPVTVLAQLANEMAKWGASYDMALCTSAPGGVDIRCFPQRLRPQWFQIAKTVNGQPLPMVFALQGQTGVSMRLDFRLRQVVAAYTPLGATGLGMVLKVDTLELYAPARRQLTMALPVIALVVLTGLWTLWMRLRPVVRALVQARQIAQANEARFIAAMESSLDAFYILRGERDEWGDLYDFRFTYVTARGADLVSLVPSQVEGQLLCELLPINRTAGFFDKYKLVLETGVPLAEEFPIEQPGVVATWISHQIVKLGDDSIAITSRDVSARKRNEEAVAKSEERLRMVTDSVPALIAYMDLDERYLFINQAGAELYGQPLADIVGRTVREVVGEANYAIMKPHIDTVAAGYPVTYERHVLRADGNRHVLTSYFPQYDDQGRVTNVCALAHDITARKQMEAALALSQDRLKAVTDNMPALISYIDRAHRFRFANLAYKDWLGVEPASLIGCSLRELYGEMAYARIRPYLERALGGETLSYEREMDTPGGMRHVHATMTPHRNSAGEIVGLYVLMSDVTALKRAEKQSALSEERLSLALEGSHLALFDWDLGTNLVYHSGHWSAMLGGPQVETTTTLDSLMHLVHPQDQAGVQEKVSACVKGVVPFYFAEHRVRTGSGEWIWVQSRGRVVERDAAGRALRLSGTNSDITEQKRIEAQLHRMAKIDSLTDLPNRALFHDRLNGALLRLRRNGAAMALMLLDIDFFKSINDSLGHDAGDAVLQEFALRLTRSVRQTDTVARLGGDEFTIILEELHTEEEANMIAAKIVASMADPFVHGGRRISVSTSIGVAYVDQAGEDAAHLIKRADQALYRAKAAGRNTFRGAEPRSGRFA